MTTAWSQDNVAGAIQHTLIGTQVTREKVLAHAQVCGIRLSGRDGSG